MKGMAEAPVPERVAGLYRADVGGRSGGGRGFGGEERQGRADATRGAVQMKTV